MSDSRGPTEVIQFKNCRADIYEHARYMETVFADGTKVPAQANDDAESVARAKALGYDDTWPMSKDHELLHTQLAEAEGLPYSPVLHAVAHNIDLPAEVIHREECVVLFVQAHVNKERQRWHQSHT